MSEKEPKVKWGEERIDMRDLEKLLELMKEGKTLEEIRREMFEFCKENGVIIIEDRR